MNKIIKALIFMAISIGIMSIISIGIISLFSNIFVSSCVFAACGVLTSIIVALGFRLMGKDIYKFTDNYKIKNVNYLWIWILFLVLSTIIGGFLGVLVGSLKNYFLSLPSERIISFINGVLIQQLLIIYFRLKGIDPYKEMMKFFKA